MAEQLSWRNLADMDLSFERSRRRAATLRARAARPRPGWRSARSLLAAAALLALAGGLPSLPVAGETQGRELERGRGKPALAASACPVPAEFREAFASAAEKTRVPLSLLVAVAYEESRMDASARSHAGAQGLLQLMPATARELELDPTIPSANVLAGARYLARMLARFDSYDLALAAYNAGPAAVEKFGGAPTLETLRYVENVKARWAKLGSCQG